MDLNSLSEFHTKIAGDYKAKADDITKLKNNFDQLIQNFEFSDNFDQKSDTEKESYIDSIFILAKIYFDNPNSIISNSDELESYKKLINFIDQHLKLFFYRFKQDAMKNLKLDDEYERNLVIFSNYIRYILDKCYENETLIDMKGFGYDVLFEISRIKNYNIMIDLLDHPITKQLLKNKWARWKKIYYLETSFFVVLIILGIVFTLMLDRYCNNNRLTIRFDGKNSSTITNHGCSPYKKILLDQVQETQKTFHQYDDIILFINVLFIFSFANIFILLILAYIIYFDIICTIFGYNSIKSTKRLLAIILLVLFIVNSYQGMHHLIDIIFFKSSYLYFNFLVNQLFLYLYLMISSIEVLKKSRLLGIYIILSSNKWLTLSIFTTNLIKFFNSVLGVYLESKAQSIINFNPDIILQSNHSSTKTGLNEVPQKIREDHQEDLNDYKVIMYIIKNNNTLYIYGFLAILVSVLILYQRFFAKEVAIKRATLERSILKIRWIQLSSIFARYLKLRNIKFLFKIIYRCLCKRKMILDGSIDLSLCSRICKMFKKIYFNYKRNNFYMEALDGFETSQKVKQSNVNYRVFKRFNNSKINKNNNLYHKVNSNDVDETQPR